MTVTAGVRELKNSLSRYLRLVREGENIIVLDRGRPVAILSAIGGIRPAISTAEHLAGLAAQGHLRLGTSRRLRFPARPPKIDLSGAVLADREERG
ncbi:MAG: type II toxin-antitoxin system prevent-host-death family antitoxin [Planctomycetes bacterium]|jgi:prevent-host-death family protein|nr:type II toxin-antitoxin system prevent-host-death family antitoxin [Planctomycetota bacterium]